MSDPIAKDHVVVVRQEGATSDYASDLVWVPQSRFASIADAQRWLKQDAPAGTYHIASLRYEDVEVKEAPPTPTRNEVSFGKQHLVRRVVTEDGAIENE